MSVSPDFFALPPIPTEVVEGKNISPKKEIPSDHVDWKNPLILGLDSRNREKIASQRRWASMVSSLREMCAETEWLFICEDSNIITSPSECNLLQSWLESLVATVKWPFPERVIIMAQNRKNKKTWKVIIPNFKKEDLPFSEPPVGLVLIPFRDKHSSGWKLSVEEIFETEKAGMA